MGYGGSGPADLALAICNDFMEEIGFVGDKTKLWKGSCFALAYKLHQGFKWDFLTGPKLKEPNAVLVISWAEISAWMALSIQRHETGVA